MRYGLLLIVLGACGGHKRTPAEEMERLGHKDVECTAIASDQWVCSTPDRSHWECTVKPDSDAYCKVASF